MALALHTAPYRRTPHLRLVGLPVAAAPPRRPASYQPPAALYRRRRLGVFGALCCLAGMAIFGVASAFGGTARADQNTPSRWASPHVVIAQSGDTLWAIARRLVPEGNITELVDQLVLMNGDAITAGQEVRIP